MAKRGLGKGLGALISGLSDQEEKSIQEIPVKDIVPSKLQPRKRINKESILELSTSIKEHGVIQPIVVRREGASFELVAGERRWRAAKKANLKSIPAIIRNLSDERCLVVALIENLQREDLNPIEEAAGYRTLIKKHGLTQEQLSNHVGKSRAAIANSLRLLNLPEKIKDRITEGKITPGHARAILSLEDPETQISLAETIEKNDLSVRDSERVARMMRGKKPKKRRRMSTPKVIRDIENKLSDFLGSKVKVRLTKRNTKVVITLEDIEQMEALARKILKQKENK